MTERNFTSIHPKVLEYGRLGYSPERIASILYMRGEDRYIFLLDIRNPSTQLYSVYVEAIENRNSLIDEKLLASAEEGDIDALEAYEERKTNYRLSELRQKLFGI